MSLKTDYKDEILRDGEDRRYNLVDENGRVVYSNIKLDKAYTPQQEGDEFNAQDVNNITQQINELLKTYTNKNILGLQQFAPLTTNALNINKDTGETNGKIEAVRTSDASTITNFFIKSGVVAASKRQYVISQEHAIVDIDMVYPFPYTKWRNVFNQTWQGWKLLNGKVPLWKGSATENTSFDIAYPYTYFNALEIFFETNLRVIVPLSDESSHVWASLISTTDEEFYLKSLRLQFTNSKTIKVLSCKEKILSTGQVKQKHITKIVAIG